MVDEMNEKNAIELLRKHSNTAKDFRGVLLHSKGVQKLAVELAKKINKNSVIRKKADVEFIRIASLLHDIGRFKIPPGKKSAAHGYEGGKILKKEGIDKRFIRVCETHVGYWIGNKEIDRYKIPIPRKSYRPRSIEEKIIAYADKRFGIKKRRSIKETAERYKKEISAEAAERIMQLHKEMQKLTEK
jgi:uncharacterized protein